VWAFSCTQIQAFEVKIQFELPERVIFF